MEATFKNGVPTPVSNSLTMEAVQRWLAARGLVVVSREALDQYAKDTNCDVDWSDPTCPVFTRRG